MANWLSIFHNSF